MRIRRREALMLALLPALPLRATFPAHTGHVSDVQGHGWWDARGEAHRATLPSRPRPTTPDIALVDWYANAA